MRIIRTEMYFEANEFLTKSAVPGVCVAWLGGETSDAVRSGPNGVAESQIAGDVALQPIPLPFIEPALRDAIQAALMGFFDPESRQGINGSYIDFVLKENVVIEQSPPVWIKLKEVVDAMKRDPRALGAFVGLLAGSEYPPLMLLTVPTGIILVGSAPAVTKAIERGLVKYIDKFFKKHA